MMGRRNANTGKRRPQKGKKRAAQRHVQRQMMRLGFERVSPSYLGGGRGIRAFQHRI